MPGVCEFFEAAIEGIGAGPTTAVVAVSGGPDSVALLDLAVALTPRAGWSLVVAHLDHGISPDSRSVAGLVQAAADRYGVPFETHRLELGADATETTARAARLEWLESVADRWTAELILTGHHRDDQVETLLMRFLNGSGPVGLAGIRPRRGRWFRPLLQASRQDILAALADRGLTAWQDPANADGRHLRNWVRNELLPVVERRVPRVRQNLSIAAGVFDEARRAWDELLDQLPGLDLRTDPRQISVAAAPLRGYSSAVVRSLIKAVALRAGHGVGKGQVDRLQRLALTGQTGQAVDLAEGGRAELAFGRLVLLRPSAADMPEPVSLAGQAAAEFGDWRVALAPDPAPARIPRQGFSTWVSVESGLAIRPWRSGDRIRPIGGRGGRLVVRCMQDAKVPRYRRPKWPVFEYRGQVVWVPGVCRSDLLLPDAMSSAMRIDVSPR